MNSLLDCYVQIREHLSKLSIYDLDNSLFSRSEDKQVDGKLCTMERLSFITIKPQQDNIVNAARVKKLSKTVVKDIPNSKIRFDYYASIF